MDIKVSWSHEFIHSGIMVFLPTPKWHFLVVITNTVLLVFVAVIHLPCESKCEFPFLSSPIICKDYQYCLLQIKFRLGYMVFLLKVSFLAILTLGYIFHKLRNVELDWTCNLPGALAWKCIILKIDHMWMTIICISSIFLAFIDNLEHVFQCFDKVIVNLDNKLPAL